MSLQRLFSYFVETDSQHKTERAIFFSRSLVKAFFKNLICKAKAKLVDGGNVFKKVFTCHFSLYTKWAIFTGLKWYY